MNRVRMGGEKAVLGDRMAFAWHFFAVKVLGWILPGGIFSCTVRCEEFSLLNLWRKGLHFFFIHCKMVIVVKLMFMSKLEIWKL